MALLPSMFTSYVPAVTSSLLDNVHPVKVKTVGVEPLVNSKPQINILSVPTLPGVIVKLLIVGNT